MVAFPVRAPDRVAATLISVAGLVGRPVRNPAGHEVGKVRDVIARWTGEPYPAVTGLVARVGRRDAFVPASSIASLSGSGVELRSARLDLADVERRPGEVLLMADVVDHQLVDVDGRRVIRAADLYLAPLDAAVAPGRFRLVGADTGVGALVRRLGPSRWRHRSHPARVIDWASIQPFGRPGEPLRLREGSGAVSRLRPADLADLLEELGRPQRQELLAALDPETAADALEEMIPHELTQLLRESPVEQAAALLAVMEPDEAADALRDLGADADALLAEMAPARAAELRELQGYGPHEAGGLMTSRVTAAPRDETVGSVRARLRDEVERAHEVDAVVVVDEDGRVVDDVALFHLLVADDGQLMGTLAAGPTKTTVTADEDLRDVLHAFRDVRRSSLVVVDDAGRPIGRILADDLVDALAPDEGRRRGLAT